MQSKCESGDNYRRCPFVLSVENQVLLMLMHYRQYRTQFHIADTYDLLESAVCRTIQRIENVLHNMKKLKLPGKQVPPGRKQEFSQVDAAKMAVPRKKAAHPESRT